jgi:hypothetical protein
MFPPEGISCTTRAQRDEKNRDGGAASGGGGGDCPTYLAWLRAELMIIHMLPKSSREWN